jgi:hypothetical protein
VIKEPRERGSHSPPWAAEPEKINNNNNNKTRVIPVIIGASGTISKQFRKYVSTIQEFVTLGNYRKLPYWALRTYFGKC